MKRLLAILLVLTLTIGALAACSDGGNDERDRREEPAQEERVEPTPPEDPPEVEEEEEIPEETDDATFDGPDPAVEEFFELLGSGEFFLHIDVEGSDAGIYFFEDMLAVTVDDDEIGLISVIVVGEEVVMVIYDMESYMTVDYQEALEIFGEDFFDNINIMTSAFGDGHGDDTYTQSGTTYFNGNDTSYCEFLDDDGEAIQIFHNNGFVVGLRSITNGIPDDTIIHDYMKLDAGTASMIFMIPEHFEEIEF